MPFPEENGLLSRSEKVIWLCFAATSAQLVFLQPSAILVPGERTNLFSGLLCFVTLLAVVIFGDRKAIRLKSPEFFFSAVLSGLAVLSALLSSIPFSASCRVFVLLSSGLGGFWCARILLNNPASQRRFQWLGLLLLAGMIIVSLSGYVVFGGIDTLIKSHPLAISNTIMLLSFAPLALLGTQKRYTKLAAAALLCSGYVVLCLSLKISGFAIPVIIGGVAALFGVLRPKPLLLALIPIILIVGLFHHRITPVLEKKLSKTYPHYRIESYPFSWHIASQHPWFGIGLRAPRAEFLQDYQFKYPYTKKKNFIKDLDRYVTPDNLYLTFMTGLGLPFLIIYLVAVVILFSRLVRLAFRPPPGAVIPPLALLLPLAMTLAYCVLYDGLLYPQNSWFFHVLLGLIPGSVAAAAPATEAV